MPRLRRLSAPARSAASSAASAAAAQNVQYSSGVVRLAPFSILALVVHLLFHKEFGIGGTSDMDTVHISDPDFVAKSA